MLNQIKNQFKAFFSRTYFKVFVGICIAVITLGAIIAGSKVSDLKQDIGTKIEQRKVEFDKIYDEKNKKSDTEYQIQNQKYKECISEYKSERPWLDNSSYISPSLSGCGKEPYRYQISRSPYLEDAAYKESTRIKETSSFALFIEKFGFGWAGVIGLVLVFVINLAIIVFRVLKKYLIVPFKSNLHEMTPFQRYLLILSVTIVVALVAIIAVLIY